MSLGRGTTDESPVGATRCLSRLTRAAKEARRACGKEYEKACKGVSRGCGRREKASGHESEGASVSAQPNT